MVIRKLYFPLFLLAGLIVIISCKPINIFSPIVDPSKMGNDAKLDAGYNAMDSGNYAKAIDYFTDVIESAGGQDLTDAYVGRGASYLKSATDEIGTVGDEIMEGNLEAGSPGDIIRALVPDKNYTDFFTTIKLSANDYNDAMVNSNYSLHKSIIFETYQTNIMAATGVGAAKIAINYNGTYNSITWDTGTMTIDEEIDEILKDSAASLHLYHIDTWDAAAGNGLEDNVDGTASEIEMMVYLTNAFNALKHLEDDPPIGMDQQDILDMETGINDWVEEGLNRPPLV